MNVRSQSDIEKIEEEVAEAINPIVWAKDQGLEGFVKQYFRRLSVIMKFLGSMPVLALRTFLWPSQIGSEFDELISANNRVHALTMKKIGPYLKTNWDKRYISVLQGIKPEATIVPKP